MIVTMHSMKNVFQNSCHVCYKVKPSESSRPYNEKREEEENDYDEYDDDDIDELFGLANKQK